MHDYIVKLIRVCDLRWRGNFLSSTSTIEAADRRNGLTNYVYYIKRVLKIDGFQESTYLLSSTELGGPRDQQVACSDYLDQGC